MSRKTRIDYEEERATDLVNVYRCYLSACDFVCMGDVWRELAAWPAQRFYVSERRAKETVKRLLKGDELKDMHPLKREMFKEIFRRVTILHERSPKRRLHSLCAEVVMQPAPGFYLSASSIKAIVRKRIKKSEE